MSKRESCLTLFYHFLTFNVSAARGRKAEALRVLYADNSSVEVVEISDIVHGQFQDALVGVDAVIHTASPLPGRAAPQDMLNVRAAYETLISVKLILLLLVGCRRGIFECFTTRREGRGQEVCCYKLNNYRGGRSLSERHGFQS